VSSFGLHPEMWLDQIVLRVRDLDAVLSYYRDVLGFEGTTELSPSGGLFTLVLEHVPDAPLRPYPCVGMYHFALLVPDRPALGAILRHLDERNEPLEGMADHLVSEALYLRDPEGNGIEVYRDRPEPDWPRRDGQVEMAADPLDVDGILAEARAATGLHPDTRFGHIHLHGRDLSSGERFFADALGMTVTQRNYRGALFFAAGDYHHHVAVNVWATRDGVPDGATGLVAYRLRLPSDGLTELRAHLSANGTPYRDEPGAVTLTDPVGAEVTVAVA